LSVKGKFRVNHLRVQWCNKEHDCKTAGVIVAITGRKKLLLKGCILPVHRCWGANGPFRIVADLGDVLDVENVNRHTEGEGRLVKET